MTGNDWTMQAHPMSVADLVIVSTMPDKRPEISSMRGQVSQNPHAVAPASVPSAVATPPHPAVPAPLARQVIQPRPVAPRPPRTAVPRSSARAKAEAAKAAAALDAFFHHAPSHGGSGGT